MWLLLPDDGAFSGELLRLPVVLRQPPQPSLCLAAIMAGGQTSTRKSTASVATDPPPIDSLETVHVGELELRRAELNNENNCKN